jgi:Spy/CpxP family protein refolding chaperone
MKHYLQLLTSLAVLVFFITVPSLYCQTVEQQPAPQVSQQGGFSADPVRQLNLTPEQREQIRSIREQNKTERAAISERVVQANRALEEALDSEQPDEAAVEQRMRDLAAAQAASMRMRILTEVKIRRVLTSEQRNILRTLRQQAQQMRRDRKLNVIEERQKRREERTLRLRNQRNGVGPFFPRRHRQRTPRP